ncbi:hypothetical protein [Ectobacillus ponti]|uniref:NadR/Ttd14 AAA domain-containing protein n=1 Tax=Ectobacillus ponti TaxID=2961894 RepID=A0AA42BSV6_9BACI|nr:hypothetical protein [Ectobacillus ponti]MCP8970944.1 hypothetical protein [Ectobacillus ponti]
MPKLFFICGPHCSGKTSILKALHQRGDISMRGSEIGKDLYYARKFQTAAQGHTFEMEVANCELRRDIAYVSTEGVVGVETWHPGNIAYAAVRNPDSVSQLVEVARKSPFLQQAQGIWLRIPKGIIEERTQTFKDDREWAGDFYSRIDAALEGVLESLGMLSRTVCIDTSKPLNEVLEEVSKLIKA